MAGEREGVGSVQQERTSHSQAKAKGRSSERSSAMYCLVLACPALAMPICITARHGRAGDEARQSGSSPSCCRAALKCLTRCSCPSTRRPVPQVLRSTLNAASEAAPDPKLGSLPRKMCGCSATCAKTAADGGACVCCAA